MKIYFISLFPESLEAYFSTSMMRKASEIGAASFEFVNLREFGQGPRKQVDDTPFGGGSGMVLMAEPIIDAIGYVKGFNPKAKVILPTPRGVAFDQYTATHFAELDHDIVLICPRYEGYDERVLSYIDYSFIVGQSIITGGELAAAIIADSIVRLLPNVLGGETSAEKESFSGDQSYIEHPQYTRPADLNGEKVPEVLLSGNHAAIEEWKRQNSKLLD